MVCRILSSAICGVEAVPVTVEADASNGLPSFSIVGSVSAQVREAHDRVRTALRNCGVLLPPKRITINLSPGDLRKDGTRFDLPIAAAVLGAIGEIDPAALEGLMLVGELLLDGSIARVPGVLPTVLGAKESGCARCFVPEGNLAEAAIVEEICVRGVPALDALIAYCRGREEALSRPQVGPTGSKSDDRVDFADIRGQTHMKRCAVIAAAGFHNLLFSGPPGAGKSMAARRIPTILPTLKREEQLEITRLHSIAGLLPQDASLMTARPFRAPHHTVTPAALCGGGIYPRPGEVTLAHKGVLFLDELPEMKRDTLEMLRQPLEDREITLSRFGATYHFPAGFLLVAAMNPCPCGYYPDRNRCTCSEREIASYRQRLSHALLDRIDLCCEVEAVTYEDLTEQDHRAESSGAMRRQVESAAGIQAERYRNTGIRFNSELTAAQIVDHCALTEAAARTMQAAFEALGLSARGYHHLLRVARTIADLESEEMIHEAHVAEAISCRIGK